MRLGVWLVVLASACGGGRTPQPAPRPVAPPSAETPVSGPVDYALVAPRAYLAAAEPLLALRREQGHHTRVLVVEEIYQRRSAGAANAGAIRDELAALAAAEPTLRYVLLLGDPAGGPAVVPSFHHVSLRGEPYFADHAFGLPGRQSPLAVGRIPARSATEVSAAVSKLVAYERHGRAGAWQRRINVIAGPAKFGALIDALIEQAATAILDRVPYEFDLRVTFAKEDSPWVYAFDQMTDKIAADLSGGSLVTVYTGHGLQRKLDAVAWRGEIFSIGDTDELARIRIPNGSPFFISLTCLTGAFGMSGQPRSLAEELALNPSGPVAVFAASASSHPVANMVLGYAFLEQLFNRRTPTVGAAVGATKGALLEPPEPLFAIAMRAEPPQVWQENLLMYNLFGDPATRLRYPERAEVTTTVAGGRVDVRVAAALAGRVTVTLERHRLTMPADMVSVRTLQTMERDQALAAMRANHARANGRVIHRAETQVTASGSASVSLPLPARPGRYAVKALVEGQGGVATGYVWLDVGSP